jgi:hypothetical protein
VELYKQQPYVAFSEVEKKWRPRRDGRFSSAQYDIVVKAAMPLRTRLAGLIKDRKMVRNLINLTASAIHLAQVDHVYNIWAPGRMPVMRVRNNVERMQAVNSYLDSCSQLLTLEKDFRWLQPMIVTLNATVQTRLAAAKPIPFRRDQPTRSI